MQIAEERPATAGTPTAAEILKQYGANNLRVFAEIREKLIKQRKILEKRQKGKNCGFEV